MKTLIPILIILYLLSIISCKKNDDKPATSGEIELSSEKIINGQTYYVNGFSFSSASIVQYTIGGTGTRPDIILNEIIDQYGTPTEVYMSSPSNYQAFKIYGTYADATSANTAFNNYLTVTETSFSDKTVSLEPYIIYTYKNPDGNYAKILIQDVQFMQRSGLPSYFQISVKWVYQPDGSETFPE